MIRSAALLQHGEQSIIDHIEDSPYSINFLEIGILPGKHISVVQKAPFGGPIAFLVDGHMIALRRTEAEFIQVEHLNP